MPTALDHKAAGAAAWKAGDWAAAVDAFGEAIEADIADASGDLHSYYSNRSACYMKLGQAKEALEDARQCVVLRPGWAKGHAREGAALSALGKATDAKRCYTRASELEPANTEYKWQAAGPAAAAPAARATSGNTGALSAVRPWLRVLLLLLGVAHTAAVPLAFFGAYTEVPTQCFSLLFKLGVMHYTLAVASTHGRPRFEMQWIAVCMHDPSTQFALQCLLLSFARSHVVATLPLLGTEFYLWALQSPWAKSRLEGAATTLLGADLARMAPAAKWRAIEAALRRVTCTAEILYASSLLFEMATPIRQPIVAIASWQMLHFRYMLDKEGHVKKTFAEVDEKITGFLEWKFCPSVLRLAYVHLIKRFLKHQVKMPEPGQSSTKAALGKCAIS